MTLKLQKGDRFGMLTVIELVGRHPTNKGYLWRVACDCGGNAIVRASVFNTGRTRSCGCLKRKGNRKTHGMTGTKVHQAWKALRQRCTNPNLRQWDDWGGRGISYDPSWDSFERFYADMGAPPPGTSLERKDNSRGYSKENCVWATAKQQNRNRRVTRVLEHNGEKKTLQEWADLCGIPYMRLLHRLRMGWSVDRALTAGKLHRFGKFTPNQAAP